MGREEEGPADRSESDEKGRGGAALVDRGDLNRAGGSPVTAPGLPSAAVVRREVEGATRAGELQRSGSNITRSEILDRSRAGRRAIAPPELETDGAVGHGE